MNTKNITVTDKPLLNTNLDTNFLKLVAIISMFIDHVGAAFFPEYPVFRWLGRLAFPIFCYCMTVGMLYTSISEDIWDAWACLPSFPSLSGYWHSTRRISWAT